MGNHRDSLRLCEELASQQLGLISAAQSLERGLSDHAIRRLVRRGEWRRFLPGVFMPRPVPSSWWTSAKAATLWGGPGCVLCGRAAARARSLKGFEAAEVEVAVATDRRSSLVEVHHYPVLPLEPAESIDTVPVIPAESMAFELCRTSSYRSSRRAIGQLIREGRMSDLSLKCLIESIGGKGMGGTRWARAILEERRGIQIEAETDSEIEFARLAARWGMDPVPQYRLRVGGRVVRRFDFAFPDVKIGIEIDGGIHKDPGVRLEDREKDAIARRAGWIVLRFTDEDVAYRSTRIRDRILEAMRARTLSLG